MRPMYLTYDVVSIALKSRSDCCRRTRTGGRRSSRTSRGIKVGETSDRRRRTGRDGRGGTDGEKAAVRVDFNWTQKIDRRLREEVRGRRSNLGKKIRTQRQEEREWMGRGGNNKRQKRTFVELKDQFVAVARCSRTLLASVYDGRKG